MYQIRFYKDRNIRDYLKVLSEQGTRAGEPYVKHLDGAIWELRPLRDRILFHEANPENAAAGNREGEKKFE